MSIAWTSRDNQLISRISTGKLTYVGSTVVSLPGTCLAQSPPTCRPRHGYHRCSLCRCLRLERRTRKVSAPVVLLPQLLSWVVLEVVAACWCHVVWLALIPPSPASPPPRGAFSVVRKCVKMTTGDQFAAKIINITKLSQKGKRAVLKRCVSLPSATVTTRKA